MTGSSNNSDLPRRDYELVNSQGCVFDTLQDATIDEAIEWADGRGDDEYRLYVETDDGTELVEVWNADACRRISLGLPEQSVYGVPTLTEGDE